MNALVLPAHGHAPYLLGVRLLQNVVDEILLPDYYGDTQRKILLEEFPADADRIFLSGEAGSLLQPLLLDQALAPDINSFSRSVHLNARPISAALEEMCRDGVESVSLTGIKKKFSRFDLALNTGLPVFSPVKRTFFAFVGKMSAIYDCSPYQSEDIKSLAGIWKEIESAFEKTFVPRLNSLAYLEYDANGLTFTPPFARPYPVDNAAIPSGATLVIASGTGLDVEKLLQLTASHPSNYVTLNDSPAQVPFARLPSASWGNPNIVAVLARSGFGSIWQALVNQKPIGVIRPRPQDDPEVFHNSKTVEWAGIGMTLDGNVTPLVDGLPRFSANLAAQMEMNIGMFGTLDGIEYASAQLTRCLS